MIFVDSIGDNGIMESYIWDYRVLWGIMGSYIWDYGILLGIMGLRGPINGIIGFYGGLWDYGLLYLGL